MKTERNLKLLTRSALKCLDSIGTPDHLRLAAREEVARREARDRARAAIQERERQERERAKPRHEAIQPLDEERPEFEVCDEATEHGCCFVTAIMRNRPGRTPEMVAEVDDEELADLIVNLLNNRTRNTDSTP